MLFYLSMNHRKLRTTPIGFCLTFVLIYTFRNQKAEQKNVDTNFNGMFLDNFKLN